jgi:hypothetical protein
MHKASSVCLPCVSFAAVILNFCRRHHIFIDHWLGLWHVLSSPVSSLFISIYSFAIAIDFPFNQQHLVIIGFTPVTEVHTADSTCAEPQKCCLKI